MKLVRNLAIVDHPSGDGGPFCLWETDEGQIVGVVDTGELEEAEPRALSHEQIEHYAKSLEKQAQSLRDCLERQRTTGAPPALLFVKDEVDGDVECDGGIELDEDTRTLRKDPQRGWVLEVEAVYSHGDAPEHTSQYSTQYAVVDGKFCDVSGYRAEPLCDADDLEAVERKFKESLFVDCLE